MKPLLLALGALVLAGCTAPAPEATPLEGAGPAASPASGAGETAASPPAGAPYEGEGVVFLPGSSGTDRAVTALPFPVNASGMAASAEVRLGSFMGVEVPVTIADVVVQLRDPAEEVLAEATLRYPQVEATLEAPGLAAGEHALVLLSYGGSDGQGYGDYVAWRLRAA